MNNLNELFQDCVRDAYSAEKTLLKGMPKLAKSAMNPQVKDALKQHEAESQNQVKRLEDVAKSAGFRPTGKTCKAAAALIEEANEVLKSGGKPSPVLDAAIIGVAQKNEHYEIASYGTMCEYAKILGLTEAHRLLKETMNEEEEADRLLSQIAEAEVNPAAAQMDGQMDGKAVGQAPAKRASKSVGATKSASPKDKISVR